MKRCPAKLIAHYLQRIARDEHYDPVADSRQDGVCKQCGIEFTYFTKKPTFSGFQITGTEDMEGPWDLCDACYDPTYQAELAEEKRLKQEAKDREQQEQRAKAKAKAQADRMKRFWHHNPQAQFYCNQKGAPLCPEAYDLVQAFDMFSDHDRDESQPIWGGLVEMGPSFLGKTTAAYHRLLTRAEGGDECLAISSWDLNQIPEAVRAGAEAFKSLVTPWYEADVLLIDDLDKTRITPRVASELWNLFEKRLRGDDALETIITTNAVTKDAFLKLFAVGKGEDSTSTGISILNRLKQHCKFIEFK